MSTEAMLEENGENSSSVFNMSLDQYLLSRLGPKHLDLETVIPLTIIYVLIFVAGVIGNICVCAVIIRNSAMHTATNYYLFSLSVSDLTLLILGLPNELSVYWQQYPWALGVGLCKFRAFVSEMVSYTSVLTIVAFSMERYLAICHPLHHYSMSGLKRALKIIATLWLFSLISAAPFAVYTTVNYLDYPPDSGHIARESAFCAMLIQNVPSNWPIYEISGVVYFLLPMVVIVVLYVRMGIKINKPSLGKQMEGSVHEGRVTNSRKAIVRMLSAVVIAFFLCWAPFHAQRLLYLYAQDSPHFLEINERLYYISGCFYYFSSTVNPILYNVMSAKYRLAFKETLCGCGGSDGQNDHVYRETSSYESSFYYRTRSTRLHRSVNTNPTLQRSIRNTSSNVKHDNGTQKLNDENTVLLMDKEFVMPETKPKNWSKNLLNAVTTKNGKSLKEIKRNGLLEIPSQQESDM